MSKEEILKQSGCYLTDLISSSTWGAIETAMDEYAKHQAEINAKEFAEWIAKSPYNLVSHDEIGVDWINIYSDDDTEYSTGELYSIFIQSQSETKQRPHA